MERESERCPDCPPAGLSWARSAFLYEGPVRRALLRVKFAGLRSLTGALAPAMASSLAGAPVRQGSILTWVPLGRGRKRARGFDQAEALARALAATAGLPVGAMLERTAETAPQARRAGRDRASAVATAFEPVTVSPANVILVDDVLTSGATAAACGAALRRAGAQCVGLVTAARSLGGPLPARCYNRPVGEKLWTSC